MKYRLQDLIDLEQFQGLQDRLNEIYSFPSAIIDNAGNILTATAWQDLCTQFHRRHPECERECRLSDQYILSHLHEANPAVTYRCPHGLVDNATPIIIDGVHYGNFFTGQFFLEPPDLEFFRAQARKCGFDEGAYLEAVKKVPIWTQEQLNSYLFFIKGLIVVLSESGLKRLKEMDARSRAETAEARARTILQTAMDGFWRVDLEGRLLEVNEAYCQMSGYRAAELLGRHVSDLEAAEASAETARHMERVISQGGDRFETKHRRKDGSVFDVEVSVQYRPADHGEVVVFLRDVTRQSQADAALRQNEAEFRAMFEVASIGMAQADPRTGRFLRVNAKMAAITGYSAEELLQKQIAELTHPDDRDRDQELFHQVVQGEAPSYRLEKRYLRKDGTVAWVNVNMTLIRDAAGQLARTMATVEDITERKRMEEERSRDHERLELAQRFAGAGLWDWDVVAGRFKWSRALFDLFGLDPNHTTAGFEAWQQAVHPEDRERAAERIGQAVKDGTPLASEYRVVLPDGGVRWISALGSTVYDQDRRPLRMSGICLDITERKQLETERQKFYLLAESSSDFIGMCDLEMNPLYVNPAGQRMVGLPDMAAACRVKVQDYYFPEDQRFIAEEFFPRVLREGHGDVEIRLRHFQTGEPIWMFYYLFSVYDANGTPVGWATVSRNISERKRVEQRLLHFHDLMQHIIAHARSAIAVHDRDLKYIYVSKRYLQEYKLKEQDIIGKHHYEVFPDLPQKWRDVHQRVLAGEVCSAEKDSYPRADGSVEWTRWEVRPWYEAEGSIGGLIVYTEVITERVRAEEALRQSEQRFRDITFTVADWVWEVDAEGRYTYASKSVEQVLGVKPEDVVGRTPFDFMPPEEARRVRAAFLEIAGRKAPFVDLANLACHRDGTLHHLLTSGVPVLDEAGALLGYRGTDKDVTRQRHLESQVRQAQKLEAIGQLAGGVAHDFNNILAAILMQLSLLAQDKALGSRQRADLTELVKEAKRGAAITRQLLAFSRRQMMERTVLDLNILLENHVNMLRRLLGEHIDLTLRGSPAPVWINADGGMVEQVVMNLCVNARDAMPHGGSLTLATLLVEVDRATAAHHDNVQPGTFVCLVVGDTGCGMDEATLQRIFEPFFTTKEVGKGTGLGLATVHGIVAQHQGWVEVDSKVGKGTTFRVYLPAVQPKLEAVPAKRVDPPLPGGKETILLIEDERTLRKAMASFLQQQGYSVIQAENGVEALRQWEQHRQDIGLLLSDMVMPEGMTGLELAERLRAQRPGLGVIIVSGYSLELVDQPRQGAGAIVCLAKPCEAAALAKAVREVLDRTRSGP